MTEPHTFAERMESLVRGYLSAGCPCRFPRFRACAERELVEFGSHAIASPEQQSLILQFDALVPLDGKTGHAIAWSGTCSRCGSHVQRGAAEVANSSWIDYLRLALAPGLEDLGADAAIPAPRCRDFYAAAPGVTREQLALANASYPKLGEEEWFEYMSARR